MKVICINDRWETHRFNNFDFPNGLPVAGNTYYVTETVIRAGKEGLVLLGFPSMCSGIEHGFYAWRFKRIEEISITQLKEKTLA